MNYVLGFEIKSFYLFIKYIPVVLWISYFVISVRILNYTIPTIPLSL